MKIKIISFYLFTVVFSVNVFAGDSLNIPQKVYQLFHNAFPEVKNESWYKSPDTYEAYFKNSDSSSCKIYYSRNGKLLHTLKYYSDNCFADNQHVKAGDTLLIFDTDAVHLKKNDGSVVNAI